MTDRWLPSSGPLRTPEPAWFRAVFSAEHMYGLGAPLVPRLAQSGLPPTMGLAYAALRRGLVVRQPSMLDHKKTVETRARDLDYQCVCAAVRQPRPLEWAMFVRNAGPALGWGIGS